MLRLAFYFGGVPESGGQLVSMGAHEKRGPAWAPASHSAGLSPHLSTGQSYSLLIALRALREMRFHIPVNPMAFFISRTVSLPSSLARSVPS